MLQIRLENGAASDNREVFNNALLEAVDKGDVAMARLSVNQGAGID